VLVILAQIWDTDVRMDCGRIQKGDCLGKTSKGNKQLYHRKDQKSRKNILLWTIVIWKSCSPTCLLTAYIMI